MYALQHRQWLPCSCWSSSRPGSIDPAGQVRVCPSALSSVESSTSSVSLRASVCAASARAAKANKFEYRVALCTEWRFVPSGALYRVALCTGWRFVPSGAFRVALSGPPYVALSAQKAPHRERV